MAPEFTRYEIRQSPSAIKFRNSYSMIVDCKTLSCTAHDNGAHKKGHHCVYLSIDLLKRSYTQLCSSTPCKARRGEVPPRSHAVPPAVSDAIGEFLCSADWTPGESVGVDFGEALGERRRSSGDQ